MTLSTGGGVAGGSEIEEPPNRHETCQKIFFVASGCVVPDPKRRGLGGALFTESSPHRGDGDGHGWPVGLLLTWSYL